MRTFLRILLSSFGLCLVVGLLWGTVAIIATMTIKPGTPDLIETMGLIGLVTTFIAAGVAFVNGAIVGAISPPERLLRRLIWHVGVYLVLAMAWSFYSAHENELRNPMHLLSTRDYAAFERVISNKKDESWGAALIHADPKAMRLCLKHGCSLQTRALVDKSIMAREPWSPATDLIIKHEYWSNGTAEQQAQVKECLQLLKELGAELDAPCIDAGFTTPLEHATEKNLPVLKAALNEMGVKSRIGTSKAA